MAIYTAAAARERGRADGAAGKEKHEARKRMFDDALRFYGGAEMGAGAAYDSGYAEAVRTKHAAT